MKYEMQTVRFSLALALSGRFYHHDSFIDQTTSASSCLCVSSQICILFINHIVAHAPRKLPGLRMEVVTIDGWSGPMSWRGNHSLLSLCPFHK